MTEIKDKVQLVNISSLVPYVNNPKKHPEEQINKIASSIKNYGWDVPIVIDNEFEIIKGHGRYKAAQKLGLKKIPVIIRDDLTKAEIKASRVADNRTMDFGSWDYEQLDLELEELEKMDVDTEWFDIELDIDGENQIDPEEEWEDMPDYKQEDKTPFKTVKVHFKNNKDLQKFAELFDQKITEKTKYIWYPEQESKPILHEDNL